MVARPKARLLALEALAAREAVSRYSEGANIRRVLNLGFGTGDESESLAAAFDATIYAVDLHYPEHRSPDPRIRYNVTDGRLLPFSPDSFDLVYCFHVLEHIAPPELVVAEIRRVLRAGGILFVGTPNRSRLFGYVGSHDASWKEKVAWNVRDYRMRLTGRFRNECGAHAGFTASELSRLLGSSFGHVIPVQGMYYARKYPSLSRLLEPARRVGLGRLLFPSVYFLCF